MKELIVLILIASVSSFPTLLGQVRRPIDPPIFSRQSIQKLIDSNRLQEAQELLKHEVVARGETAETVFLEGVIRFKQKRFMESLKAAERSLALGLRDSEVYKLVAFNGVLLNRLDVVEPALNKALELVPGDWTVHFHLGFLYFTTNRFALAEGQFQEVTKLKPDHMKGYDMLGQAREELEKDDAALDAYRKAIELTEQQNLKDESAYLHLAKFLWAKNRYQESLAPARRAVELNPKSAEAYYVLGRLLDRLGQEAEAMKALKRSTEIDPDWGESYYLLSRIYLRRGRQEEAANAMKAFKTTKGVTQRRDVKRADPGPTHGN